jgi:hypothetical protein
LVSPSSSYHYWKTSRLGTAFKTFIDTNEMIDNSNFPEELKEREKANILEAKKCAQPALSAAG